VENDGMVRRIVHHQVPPKVEYALTDWGQALCPALDALLKWAALREEIAENASRTLNRLLHVPRGSDGRIRACLTFW
jgi:DNA-binding HxlR family transcriptional regulator